MWANRRKVAEKVAGYNPKRGQTQSTRDLFCGSAGNFLGDFPAYRLPLGLLEAHNLTAYQLWKASGLSKTGVYNLVTPKGLERATGVEFGTLAKLISGLEKLTGRCVSLDDLLEVVRDSKGKSAGTPPIWAFLNNRGSMPERVSTPGPSLRGALERNPTPAYG